MKRKRCKRCRALLELNCFGINGNKRDAVCVGCRAAFNGKEPRDGR